MIRRIALASVVAALATGCPSEPAEDDIIIYGLTAAPPASKGSILNSDLDGYRVTLSRGVAIGGRCWDSCDSTCIAPRLTVGDPTLLGVRPLWRPNRGDADMVLVGMQTGTTTLTVETSCARRDYQVEIIER